MSRKCYFTGKTTRAGGSTTRRGKAKYLGGVGRKITGRSKRKFKPNIQRVRAVIDGRVVRVKVSAKAIRMGLVTKPPKRTWRPEEKTIEAGRATTAVMAERATEAGE
jgi:large subunit ribosomal protein L28